MSKEPEWEYLGWLDHYRRDKRKVIEAFGDVDSPEVIASIAALLASYRMAKQVESADQAADQCKAALHEPDPEVHAGRKRSSKRAKDE